MASGVFGAFSAVAVACMAIMPSGAVDATPSPQVKPAVDGVLDLFRHNSIVGLSNAEDMAQESAFYSTLVLNPRFAEQVGNVVFEMGDISAQPIIDRYVNGEDVPLEELRKVWDDTTGAFPPGAPTPLGYINFYAAIRAANSKLPPEHKIKVWLTDPEIDWSKIHSASLVAQVNALPAGAAMPGTVILGGPSAHVSARDMMTAKIDILSGRTADALLYLGPPDTLTESPVDPATYLDLEYFKQKDQRARCRSPSGQSLDWSQLLQQNSGAPRAFNREGLKN